MAMQNVHKAAADPQRQSPAETARSTTMRPSAEIMDAGRLITQRKLVAAIHGSPRVVAQRTRLGRLFGERLQLTSGPQADGMPTMAADGTLQRQGSATEELPPWTHESALWAGVVQAKRLEDTRLNVVGEDHNESESRRKLEKQIAERDAGGGYWTEEQFRFYPFGNQEGEKADAAGVSGDPHVYRIAHRLQYIKKHATVLNTYAETAKKLEQLQVVMSKKYDKGYKVAFNNLSRFFNGTIDELEEIDRELTLLQGDKQEQDLLDEYREAIQSIERSIPLAMTQWRNARDTAGVIGKDKENEELWKRFRSEIEALVTTADEMVRTGETQFGSAQEIMQRRNIVMNTAAKVSATRKGVWKIGNQHATDIQARQKPLPYNLMTRDEFYLEPTYKVELKPDD